MWQRSMPNEIKVGIDSPIIHVESCWIKFSPSPAIVCLCIAETFGGKIFDNVVKVVIIFLSSMQSLHRTKKFVWYFFFPMRAGGEIGEIFLMPKLKQLYSLLRDSCSKRDTSKSSWIIQNFLIIYLCGYCLRLIFPHSKGELSVSLKF